MARHRRQTGLKRAVQASGLKQNFLANQLGISKFRMSRIVRGHYVPTPEEKRHLAGLLGRPVRELFDEEAMTA